MPAAFSVFLCFLLAISSGCTQHWAPPRSVGDLVDVSLAESRMLRVLDTDGTLAQGEPANVRADALSVDVDGQVVSIALPQVGAAVSFPRKPTKVYLSKKAARNQAGLAWVGPDLSLALRARWESERALDVAGVGYHRHVKLYLKDGSVLRGRLQHDGADALIFHRGKNAGAVVKVDEIAELRRPNTGGKAGVTATVVTVSALGAAVVIGFFAIFILGN